MTDTGDRLARKQPNATRQVRLTLRYVNVWSATKTAFLFGVGAGILSGVVVILLWSALTQFGVFAQLDSLLSGNSGGSSSIASAFGFSQAAGAAALIGPLNAISSTLIGTIGAALYNLGVRIVGGATVGFSTDA